jgi:hypothetical protein
MSNFLKFISLAVGLGLCCSCTTVSPTTSALPLITSTAESPHPTTIHRPTAVKLSSTPQPASPTFTFPPPTATGTPAPARLNPDGPYVLYFGHGGTWVSNPDGSFATKISDYELNTPLDMHRNLSPRGDFLALVSSNEKGLDLILVSIPDGRTETIAHLIDSPPPGAYNPISANSFATYAIRDYDSVAWQPGEGRFLAFIGAIHGPTADLYMYDTQTKAIIQLTDGPSQAINPVWSPDGQHILHFGVSWVPPFGGAILGANQLDGVWAVRASDGKVITLPKNKGEHSYFLGWQDDEHFITYDAGDCSTGNLHTVDIVTGETNRLMEASFYSYIAHSPQNGAILFSSALGCADSLGEGIFLLPYGQATPIKLIDRRAWTVEWMPESGIFYAYPEGLFTQDGRTHYPPPLYDQSYHPAISKLGYQAWVVYENYVAQVMLKVPDKAWQKVITGVSGELVWDPAVGNTLLIASEDGLLYAATYSDFTPRQVADFGGGAYQVIWSP